MVEDIIKHMKSLAPEELALEWDNIGLIVGDSNAQVNTILIALDVTDEVLEEAINLKAELIITHHPLIFKPIKNINDKTPIGRKILKLIKNGISVYSSHTNLDISNYGTNDTLFKVLNLQDKQPLMELEKEGYALGRIGTLDKPVALKNFAIFVKESLKLTNIRYTGNDEKIIKKLGICTGASSNYNIFKEAKEKGCDLYITGDIKFHEAQTAIEMGLCLMDATHYASEVIVTQTLKDYLKNKLNSHNLNIITSKTDGQTFKNI